MAMMERLMAAVFAKVRRAAQTAVSAASYSYDAAVSGGEHPPQIWLLSANIRSTHLAKGIHTRYYWRYAWAVSQATEDDSKLPWRSLQWG